MFCTGDYGARHGAQFRSGTGKQKRLRDPDRERKAAEHKLPLHSVPILPWAREFPSDLTEGLMSMKKQVF
jgi:hypothetical protein